MPKVTIKKHHIEIGKLRHINKVRYFIQVLVLLFILSTPILSLYQSNVAARAIQWMDGNEKLLFGTIDNIVRWFTNNPENDLDIIKGSVWSAQIGDFKMSDPLALLGQFAAEKQFYWPFVATILFPVGLTLLLGRFFCGWICPAYLFYEIGDVFRQLLNRAGTRPRNIKLSLKTKYIVLGLGTLTGIIFGVVVFPMIYPPAIISREWYYLVYLGVFGSGLTLLGVSLLFEMTMSRRAVCRYLCPGGALYSLLGKFRVVRIRRNASACIDCVKCNHVCGLGLEPMSDLTGMECNTCTACIAICPTDALTLRLGWKDDPLKQSKPNPKTLQAIHVILQNHKEMT
ncbi:uncharacterized protein METZ01_LOCUS5701 [marine metagenome]|uniref:4Fe-4S ferredoxin-type domain-containing protein n=1 Tax=marine metagenome TaxID=408172 RepID=A0A381NE95_9ZZZZ